MHIHAYAAGYVYYAVNGCSIDVAFDISALAYGSTFDCDFNGGGSGSKAQVPQINHGDNDFGTNWY